MTAGADGARGPWWAAGRVPTSTPPTVPWRPADAPPGPGTWRGWAGSGWMGGVAPGAGPGPGGPTAGAGPAGIGTPPGFAPAAGTGPSGAAGGTGGIGWAGGVGGAGPGAARESVRELATEVGRWAFARIADGVEDGLAALAARRDPLRRHERRLRRTRRKVELESTVAGGLGVLAVAAGVAPGWTMAEVGLGGAAMVVGATAVGAARRLRQLRQHPPQSRDLARPRRALGASLPPRPPRPPRPLRPLRPLRPPRDCPARPPIDRLDERERALTGLLVHLGPAGEEPRQVAAHAAATLRELGDRVTAVDRARRGAAPGSAAGLDAAVGVLVHQLEAGVAAYDALVVAAADAVAASATLRAGDQVLLLRLTEATDSLAGLAAGLREISG